MPAPREQPRRRALLLTFVIAAVLAAGEFGAVIENAVSPQSTPTGPASTVSSVCDATAVAGRELPSVVTIFSVPHAPSSASS